MRARKFTELSYEMAGWKSKAAALESEKRYLDLKIQELENKILDLQPEQTKTEENKENKIRNNQALYIPPKKKPETKTSIQPLDYKQRLINLYGAENVEILSPDDIKAKLEEHDIKKVEIKSNLPQSVEGNDNEKNISQDFANKEHESNSLNKDSKKKTGIQFADNTKREDGGRRRPRGKNSYVFNPKTNVLRKIN